MLSKKPDRNFSRKVLDVFHPKKNNLNQKLDSERSQEDFQKKEEELNKIFSENKNEFTNLKPKIKKTFPEIWLALILILLIGLGLYFKNTTQFSLPKINPDNYQETYNFLKSFQSKEESSSIDNSNRINFLFSLLSKNFGSGEELIKNLNILLNEGNNLLNHWPEIILGKSNPDDLRQSFLNISEAVNFFKDYLNQMKSENYRGSDFDYLIFKTELNRLSNFLNNFINFMEDGKEHRFLVLFSNTSEMRPGGGFIGSYADISVSNWKINQIEILDINEPDKKNNQKIIPPKALQNVIISWKAADSNWFFDFKKSALKTIQFLENSDFYKENNVKFDGALLITPQVISDILSLTGPIEINSEFVFNQDNFLIELQKIIQEKRSKKDLEPKQVLTDFFNKILEKFSGLNLEDKNKILDFVFNWRKNKDINFYFKNKDFQSLVEAYDLAGKIQKLEPSFFGDYLAVVDANPASGKSDIFIQKKVNLKIQISNNGILNNNLEIKRYNFVKNSDAWWYKLDNLDFVQIFTPAGSELLAVFGGEDKKIYPRINYQKNGFIFDESLNYERTEKIIEAFPQIKIYNDEDKNIFGTFLTTPLQTTSILNLEYSRKLFKIPKSGNIFTFILEKQIGDRGEYNIEINAPIGFKFKENNSSVFQYQSKNSAEKEVINLTLVEDI
jgi:hypothetical protein